MLRFIGKRVLMLVVVFIGVSAITFTIMHFTPGDPVMILLGENPATSPEMIKAFREKLGLDEPVYVQYLKFLWRVAHLDLGRDIRTDRLVSDEVIERLPNTIMLAASGMAVSILLSIPVGIISAVKQYSAIDKITLALSTFTVSMPNFWLALMLIYIFGYQLRLTPISGIGGPQYLILPALSLGAMVSGWILRLMRSTMLEVLRQDYVRTARMKGLSERVVIFKHALRNAMIPVVTMIGLRFGQLLGGAFVVEQIFAYPGVGMLTLNAINLRNYPVVLGAVLLTSVVFIVINLVVDLLYVYIDPRIKYE